jgi:TRAP-type mannitol/chloroaromatic compound transport system permease small subunit
MTTILLLCSFVLVVAYALNHITFNLKYNEIGKQSKTWVRVFGGVFCNIFQGIAYWYIIENIIK